MKINNVIAIFKNMNYSGITSDFIQIPEIARINLTNDGSSYRNDNMKFYLDTAHNLLYIARFCNTLEDGVCAIIDTEQIVSIETRNLYSASVFSGNKY